MRSVVVVTGDQTPAEFRTHARPLSVVIEPITVAAAGFDGSVRLFDAASGKLLKEFVPVPISEKKEVATASGK